MTQKFSVGDKVRVNSIYDFFSDNVKNVDLTVTEAINQNVDGEQYVSYATSPADAVHGAFNDFELVGA